ncbi:hypothetical protein [Marinomonas shanghaiensis]|uniref:hypothetical protein n=1 Tax=Marinomonas shanghaiensis TaxID=2202418 RepID=UPI003A9338E9
MKKQKYKHWENTLSQRLVKWLWDRFGVADRMHLRAAAIHARMEQGSLMNKVEKLERALEKEKIKHPNLEMTAEDIEKIEHQRLKAYLWRTQRRFWKEEDAQK